MKNLCFVLVVAACVAGCGSASGASESTSSTTPAPSAQSTNASIDSDESLLQRNLDECFAAADRHPDRRDGIRPVCLCIISGGTDDAQLLRDLRAGDEPSMTERARACATPSRLLPFVTLDRCLRSRPDDYEACGRVAQCVGEQVQQIHPGPDFDAWFTALTPEQRRQLGHDAGTACLHELPSAAQNP